ncbi:hypothetical protein [Deinococcus marmoris]|uniref:hypothetical protein n=3 Tax=Deinococcus marmoris TaxID=249408 RepID=UPI0012DD50FA|nr:hypothetical protein [Deinococcus marmoris]
MSIVMLSILLITGLVPQLNIFIFGDYIYNINLFARLILLINLLILLLLSSRIDATDIGLKRALIIFIAYAFLTFFVNSVKHDLAYSLQGSLMYFYLFLLYILTFIQRFDLDKNLEKTFVYIAIPLAGLAIAQHFTANSILPLESANGQFKVLSWLFWDDGRYQVRGYSLFTNAVDFGIFIIFCLGIVIQKIDFRFSNYKNILSIIIFSILLISAYSTLTRNVYIGAIITVLSSIAYLKFKKRKVLLILPLLSLALGLLISLSGDIIQKSSINLSNSASLDIRQEIWSDIWQKISNGEVLVILFGDGRYQAEAGNNIASFLIDNSFLQFITYQGILGLILFAYLYFYILKNTLRRPKNALWCGFYGFLVAWPAMAVFNILVPQLAILTLLTFFIDKFSITGGVKNDRDT